MTTEEWRPIPGYAGYEVSDLGRVRSYARYPAGRLLGQRLHGGYMVVKIADKQKTVHRLLALAFLGPGQPGQLVRHLNDKKTDNRLENLSYGSLVDNAQDAIRNGVNPWAKREQCVNGHDYTPQNTRISDGKRICRACKAATARRLYWKAREVA